jgi:hypothetical protein
MTLNYQVVLVWSPNIVERIFFLEVGTKIQNEKGGLVQVSISSFLTTHSRQAFRARFPTSVV